MAGHLHKSFRGQQVRALLQRYVNQEIQLQHVPGILKIGRSRFFEILKDYREDPLGFMVACQRKSCSRKLAPEIEKNTLRELRFEKRLIENPDVPRSSYNYSYIRDRLRDEYHQKVSVPTIIKRAKEPDLNLSKPKRKAHDREVLQFDKHRYNNRQVQATTGEIPTLRFRRALKEKRILFRESEVPRPFRSTKDIFTLDPVRLVTRIENPYGCLDPFQPGLAVSGTDFWGQVNLRRLFSRVVKSP